MHISLAQLIGKFFLNINQFEALNFIISLFQASTCFEHMCSSSGGQNCIIQSLVSSDLQVAVPCTGRPPIGIFTLVVNQLDAQNLFYNKFISCLYMFRAPCAHRQEGRIVLYSLWYHHTETSELSKITKIIKIIKIQLLYFNYFRPLTCFSVMIPETV